MKRPITISDHALVRWLERGHGIDMESFRKMLADIVTPAIKVGASAVHRDGLVFVIRDNSLVTVMPKGPCRRFEED